MKELDIQNAFARDRMKWLILLPNYTPDNWYECDLFGVTKAGYMVEHEIKVTIADFRADAKKGRPECRYARVCKLNPLVETKHGRLAAMDHQGPSRYNYIVPADMIGPDEVPEWAGLIYASQHPATPYYPEYIGFNQVKKAPRLHSQKVAESVIAHARGVCYFRYWSERLRRGA